MDRYAHPNLGRLIQPRHTSSIEQTAQSGRPWAADNDCYQALDADAYERMLRRIKGLSGCLFVTVPDVVADANATATLWDTWAPIVKSYNLPRALVLQDGLTESDVPWDDIEAVFVGGSTEYKLGTQAAKIVAEANKRQKWTHMGRVNTQRRIRYAKSIGIKSIDGTKYARFKRAYMREGLAAVSSCTQLNLLTDDAA